MQRRPVTRSWIVFFLSTALLGVAGQSCPRTFFPPPADFVTVELINETDFPVDPGLFVDGLEFVLEGDPLLAAGEIVTLEFDCFAGTKLQTDAILLAPEGQILSDNVPLVEEGFEFLCGDVVSFIFIDNGVDPFYTEVDVNGEFVMD